MKTSLQRTIQKLIFLISSLFFSTTQLFAQCNVNDKYDKIVSGYHSSIALKDNGVYSVWGSDMSSTGTADVLSPQDINSTNYPGLTGTVLKVAMGGKYGGPTEDQAIILTTTGLWAWGVEGTVFNNSLTSSAAFQRITSISGATLGLPTGVAPTDVASLFASYQTLCVLTTTGTVWILTQTSIALEANGGTVNSAGSSTWKQVKTSASTNLTNVVAVRGQVSSINYNAFIALTSTGQVYTWGSSTYLGDASVSAARYYATQMTLPSEFTSTLIPKMIGVTGGISSTATTKNTYFLLSRTGTLYSLGDNTQKQCGDFTIIERTGWVNVKMNSTTNFTNVNFFSVQEHTSAFPGAAAITTAGNLYTWGNNSSSMLGRTDNGTSTGAISATYDPGMPVIFTSGTDKAVSAEVGGHTLVYLKEGTTQFCYVGHRTNGSMGDGTTGSSSNGAYYASCTSTPSLNICGSVPVAASSANSTISTSAASILANGLSVATITIQLKNASGTNLTTSGGVVIITTSAGTISSVTDNNNGTYMATLTSSTSITTASLGFSINGTAATATTSVNFVSTLPLSWLNASAYRVNNIVKIRWTIAEAINVKSFEIERSLNGKDWNVVMANIPFAVTNSTGYYEQQDTTFNPQELNYRIRQEDIDGHFTYSPVFTVAAISGNDKISIYPMPLENNFHLNTASPGKIKSVQLISLNGNLLRKWNQFQTTYDLQGIPSGNYILRVETDNDVQVIKLVK